MWWVEIIAVLVYGDNSIPVVFDWLKIILGFIFGTNR
jgi:hypothetical protein